MCRPLSLVGEQFAHCPGKVGNLGLDNVPDEVLVDTEVAVDQTVSHAGHAPPFDLGVFVFEIGGNPLGGFSDNLETPDKRPSQGVVFQKHPDVETLRRLDQIVGFVENVL